MEENSIKNTSPSGRAGGAGTPRGFRNKNPLNIRLGVSHWQHQARIQTDPAFVVFDEMKWGYRAAWKLMESYKLRMVDANKPYNIHNIICRWAPPNENDTQAYIKTVVKLSGIGEYQVLTPPSLNGEQVGKILAAMTCVENGITMEQVPVGDLMAGYKLAW